MADHVTSRRKFRRTYAILSFWLASVLLVFVTASSVLIPESAKNLSQISAILAPAIMGLYGLFGWYMKLGSDENKIHMQGE